MNIIEDIKAIIEKNPIVLFMKGSPNFPQCGFSARTSEILKACDVEFKYVDILEKTEMRTHLPQYSNWPTFPQLFIKGELIGGYDIASDLYQKGELQKMTQNAITQ